MTVAATQRSPFVYASSLAIDVQTMKLVPEADSIANETRVVCDRISARLAKAGVGLEDVVKTTCYLSDGAYLDEFTEAYNQVFAGATQPVNCTVFLGLAGNCRVQIEVVAVRSGAS